MTDEYNYEYLAKRLNERIGADSNTVSSSIADIAKTVSEGTKSIAQAVSVSEENNMPPQAPRVPAPNFQVPNVYVQQAPQDQSVLTRPVPGLIAPYGYAPQSQQGPFESVTTRLQRLRA